MNYHRRPQHKRLKDYLMPFFVILIFILVIIFGWRTLNSVLIDNHKSTYNEKVFLNIENGSAKAMTVGRSEWQNVPDNIYLYRGERLKTNADGRASLTFFDQSLLRLDHSSEIAFTVLKQKKETRNIEVELEKGDLWMKVERINNPHSNFTFTTDLLTIDTRGATFAVTVPGTAYIIEGSVQVGVKHDDEIIKTFTVGVGQQFTIDQEGVENLYNNIDRDVIFALSDPFKQSNWYRWNMKKDGAITAFEESDEMESDLGALEEEEEEVFSIQPGRLVYITKPSKNTTTNQSTLTIEGHYDKEKIVSVHVQGREAALGTNNKWKISNVKLELEGKNSIAVEAEKKDGEQLTLDPLVIVYDNTTPITPTITVPGTNDEIVNIDDIEQEISGSVSSDTHAVIINDYRLAKYVPGSKTFRYYAKTVYGNLEVGENEYLVYAEDKAGNKSEPAQITLILKQEVADAAEEKKETEKDESSALSPATSTGGVTITSPNSGKNLQTTETSFQLSGNVPENTDYVVINDYRLKA